MMTTSLGNVTNIILHQVDPYVLDDTLENLNIISGGGDKDDWNNNNTVLLPLKANIAANYNSADNDDDDDDNEENRPYLETSFNEIEKNGKKAYRSPWTTTNASASNKVEEEILEFEKCSNELWDVYRQLYYGHDAIGSVYVQRKGGDTIGSPVKSKKKSSGTGALEAYFGIQNKCIIPIEEIDGSFSEEDTNKKEIARWDSVHRVTIDAPNYDDKTCKYRIESQIWFRFNPIDVGDIPPEEKKKAAAEAASKKKEIKKPPAAAKPKKNKLSKMLDKSRLEIFDKAKDNWDSRHSKNGPPEPMKKKKVPVVPEKDQPPVPATVKSSAYYEKETIQVCKFVGGGTKNNPKIPSTSHIQNIGTILEKLETEIRSKLERVNFPTTCEVIQGMYGGKAASSSGGQQRRHPLPGINNHATGMGVGASLIGEIALKAKSKGLGDGSGADMNKAMESILASQKKKLADNDVASDGTNTTTTNDWRSNLKKKNTTTSSRVSPPHTPIKSPTTSTDGTTTNTPTNDWRSKLKKKNSARMLSPPITPTKSATPEFMRFRKNLKASTTTN